MEGGDGEEEFGRDCAVSPAGRIGGISGGGGTGGGAFGGIRIERRGDTAVSCRWEDFLWDAAVTAGVGCGVWGVNGNGGLRARGTVLDRTGRNLGRLHRSENTQDCELRGGAGRAGGRQRERGRDRGFGGCGRGDEGELLHGKSGERKDCTGERAARSCAGFGGGEVWRGRNFELCAEPEDGVVG